jgi:hypothetical protein
MTVNLAIDGFGERRFEGTIERINPTTEPGTRAILVFIRIPNPDGALRGGMFGTGRVTLAAGAPVPTLPTIAVRTEAGQNFVWTIEQGKLARRIVTVGKRAVRQSEDRRAGTGARRGARAERLGRLASGPRRAREEVGHVDHSRLDQEPGLRNDGHGRDRRPRGVLVRAAARRADARRLSAVLQRHHGLSGRLARGRGNRRQQAH